MKALFPPKSSAFICHIFSHSQDGFIADSQVGVDWLPQPSDEKELEELGYNALIQRIGSIVMGHNSYMQIIGFGEWAWPDKKTYFFTTKKLEASHSSITFVEGDPLPLITKLKQESPEKDIWLLGGANLARQFAENQLIDECIITEVSTLLGDGIKLDLPMKNFDLISEKSFPWNIIQKKISSKKLK